MQKGNSVILIILIVIIIAIGGAYFISQKSRTSQNILPNATPAASPSVATDSSTPYKNIKYGYSVSYPPVFSFRENSDGSGIGLIPSGKSADAKDDAIWITVLHKSGDPETSKTPLAQYYKTAAAQEIQNYNELNSVEIIKTDSEEIGYKTTWKRSPPPMVGGNLGAKSEPSLPITYFELSGNPYYTVQIHLTDELYLSEYNQIIKTFSTK